MMPIFIFPAMLNAVLCAVIVTRLRRSQQSNQVSIVHRRFIVFYEFFGLTWFSWAIIDLVPSPFINGLLDITGYFLLAISCAYMVQIPLLLYQKNRLAIIVSTIEGIVASIYPISRLINFHPLVFTPGELFYIWLPSDVGWLVYLLGISVSAAAIAISATFYIMSRRSSYQIKTKSVYLVLGELILLAGAIVAFLDVPYENTLFAYTAAAAIVAVGLIITLFAISHFSNDQPASPPA